MPPPGGGPDSGRPGAAPDAASGAPATPDGGQPDGTPADGGRDAGPARRTPSDGGSPDAAIVDSPLATTVAVQNAGTIDALAIDGATLYGLTDTNSLWVVDPGSGGTRTLTQDTTPDSFYCLPASRLTLDSSDVFWLTHSTLHRTHRSDGHDTPLVTDISSAPYPTVAADDARVYWTEETGSVAGLAGLIRTLPVDAEPGTTPTTLVAFHTGYDIITITLSGPLLYWVSSYQYTTMFTAALYDEAVSDLLAVQPPKPIYLGDSWFVQPHGGDLYVGIYPDSWTQDLGRRSPDGYTADLGTLGGSPDAIVFVDDWALISIRSDSCGDRRHHLIAVPTGAAGGPIVHLADDLGTPAILGTELAYVDLSGDVHTSTLDQVRAALAVASR